MSTVAESSFQFIEFLVTESHLSLRRADGYDCQLSITPSGVVFPAKRQFQLQLQFEATDAVNQAEIKLVTMSLFTYANIPDIANSPFLIQNSPAIVFPYIRAYISTLTTQSGISPIVLPTWNLSSLAELLRQHIEVSDEL